MIQELAQDIALMRYFMISPLIVGLPEEFKTKEAYFRAAPARGALHPNGSPAAAMKALPERLILPLRNRSGI